MSVTPKPLAGDPVRTVVGHAELDAGTVLEALSCGHLVEIAPPSPARAQRRPCRVCGELEEADPPAAH